MESQLKRYNLSNDEAIERIKSIIDGNRSHYNRIRTRCVATKKDNNWYNLAIISDVVLPNETVENRPSRKYENVWLLETFQEPEQFTASLDSLSSAIIRFGDLAISFGTHFYLNRLDMKASGNSFSPHNGHLFEGHGIKEVYPDYNAPLVDSTHRYYSNVLAAASDWLGIKGISGSSDSRLGRYFVFLPERRAFFSGMGVSDGCLGIAVENNIGTDQNLSVKGAWKTVEDEIPFENSVETSDLEIEVPDSPVGVEILLLDHSNIYDFHMESNIRFRGRKRLLVDFPEEVEDGQSQEVDILSLIRGGEGERVEFKKYIKIHDANKVNELVRTTIAFANTKGGSILIGVSDSCVPEGIGKRLFADNDEADDKKRRKLEEYSGDIIQCIKNKVGGDVALYSSVVAVDDNYILKIDINEGLNKPYYIVENNEIYVRRGSSNRRPDPITELPGLCCK